MPLVRPAREHLAEYVAALETGWSPDNLRAATAQAQLAEIAQDADGFLAGLYDPEGRGPAFTLADGTSFPRLPGFRLWMWSDGFCGSIGFRWRARGDATLPPHVLGHIGYAVVPWRRGQGHATRALAEMLEEARALDLPYVELTTEVDNPASQHVILNNDGAFRERFIDVHNHDGRETLRFRIDLQRAPT